MKFKITKANFNILLKIILIFSCMFITLSASYYFVFFLPKIENAKLELIQKEQERKILQEEDRQRDLEEEEAKKDQEIRS